MQGIENSIRRKLPKVDENQYLEDLVHSFINSKFLDGW